MRAIETGRHVVVASTNGITGIIAPDGTPTSVLDRWTQGYVVEQVPLTSDVPPGIRVGPALGLACVVVGICALAAALLPYRRTDARPPAARVMASSVADRPPTDEDHP